MTKSFCIAQYDAFSDVVFGGSQAAVITNAASIDIHTRQKIAKEIGMPATAFVDDYTENWIKVQFMSTVMELPMCGHGTICLLTRLTEPGFIAWQGTKFHSVELRLPNGTAMVELAKQTDNRISVMLDVKPPDFVSKDLDLNRLYKLLQINSQDIPPHLPIEIATGDFIHLVVPTTGLDVIKRITPDFANIVDYCRQYGIETITPFCLEVENSENRLHVRDFCPAVGVPESAAAGTTNAALTSYLVRHGLIEMESKVDKSEDVITLSAEQGHEIDRPSRIFSKVTMLNGNIIRLQVGGVASKIMEGKIFTE